MFFSPRNKDVALGMYSTSYFITLAFVIIIITLCLFFSFKMKEKNIKKVLITFNIFTVLTEIIKMIFTGINYGIDDVEWLPLYFCSLFMYSTLLAVLKNEKLKITGLSFLFFGGIIGAVAFFSYPNACIPNYPLFHFMTLRTLIYHGGMIYVGLLVVITGYYKPDLKHFKNYTIYLSVIMLLAYIINIIRDRNLMYISEPLDFSISENLYNLVPKLYPFIFMVLQTVVPFFTSFLFYKLFLKVNRRKYLCLN